ncbi:hypothetical protein TRFO_07893 [Tritrichomonas foetus]|uniref:Piezo non-specific cation channel cap domain-containing protein n=1 Tax=Tritrichomonas foetus TaxID=1144522 RepID=A0A1J4JSS8_9EUKA|nr:hypothetical protein TRFO_07893 [Tritrichomonas foetus]|eukprot:OHT00564.1 hypothetical protein TRFO_07893 [Tritrichomonas foetus]
MQEDSSDPSSTYSSSEIEEEEKEEPIVEEPKNEEDEKEGKVDPEKVMAIVLIVFIDILIPLMLILSAISCMSVMGMVFVLLLYLHIFICNKVRKSFTSSRVCLIIDFIINLVVFVFAIIGYVKKIDAEWIKILGLDFDNIIAHTPDFTTATSLIAMICQIISLVLIGKTKVEKFVEIRIKVYSSLGVQYGFDLVWAVCNAFNAASNSSYLYLPILLFFVISNISQSCVGVNIIPSNLTTIIMAYSLLFALFELYMVSYIGEKYDPSERLRYNYIAEDNTKGVNVVIAVLFAYISVQNMSAPGLNGGKRKPVPQALKVLSDGLLIIAFLCTFVFAMFYPNYLSILWMLIPAMASFVKFPTLRKLMFPTLTIVFTLSFVSQACTTFYLFGPPADNGIENMMPFVRLFGLYRYPNNFTFTVCGFYIICLLGQIGKIVHSESVKKEKKNEEEEEKKEEVKVELNNEEEETSEEREERLRLIEKAKRKAEAKAKQEQRIKKIKSVLKKIGKIIYTAFSYIAVAAIIIIGIAIGFYQNRFAFKILCACFIIIVLLALYKRPVFEIIKIVSGLMAMFAAFYKTTINEDCALDLDQCMIYGQWDSNVADMISTGLIPPIDMSLAEFIWPIAVIFALSTFLTADPKALEFQLPPFITSIVFIVVAILHFLYMFLYDTNIFSLLFLIVGILMLTSMYLNKKGILAFSCCLSCIVVSFQLVVLLLSHFDNCRNLITSVIPKSIIDISHIYGPTFEICLLAGILFCSTIAFSTRPDGKMNYFVDSVLYEIRVILDLFYFYLSWVFIFMFSIVNNNASFIKFLLMLFFAFGRWSAPVFWKIRIPFLIFNVVYLVAQFVVHIFDFDDNTKSYYEILRYIGFYFNAPNKPTNSERNLSVAWQLVVIIFGVINAKSYSRRVTNPKFDALLSTRIYNAICACLHHWLAIIIQISLCVSTLLNPTLFGWFFFFVMVLVNYNTKALQSKANLITLIFNICFMIQYLLYLGYPAAIFKTDHFNVVNYVPDDKQDLLINWLKWIGIYDVTIVQLTSNCISAFFFTFYLTWYNTFVDYSARFNELPDILKQIINLYTTYVYEIMFSLIIIVASCIRSIDGCLFFVLASILFICSLLMNYPKFKALNIMSIATFLVIALRLLSRLPVFTHEGIADWIKKAFDLPLDGNSSYETLWIIVYALERLTIHIMKSKIYSICIERHEKHMAFRFIRSRQIAVLEKLDQDILNQKHLIEIEQINNMHSQGVDEFLENLSSKPSSKHISAPAMTAPMTTVAKAVQTRANSIPSTAFNSSDSDSDDNEADLSAQKEKSKFNLVALLKRFYKALSVKLIRLLAGSLHMNSEAGINVLTLETLTTLMTKVLRTYEANMIYEPNEEEKYFFEKLPPSFSLHLQSLADVLNYQTVNKTKRFVYLLQYIFMFLRRLSLPLLTFMILIYMYIKPYLFSMIVIVMFCCLILPLDIKGFPIIYQVYLGLVMFLFALRNICTLDILEPYILDLANSVTVEQMSISVIKLFGIDPSETSVVEIFLFLFSVYFIVDQLQWCEVYPPKYYLDKFRKVLPGFPKEYCYGIMNDPISSLALDVEKPPGFFDQFVSSMSRAGLIETSHSFLLLIIDVISFILLLILWGMWTHGQESRSPLDTSGTSFVFKIDVAYVFILLIHVIFSLACYAFSLSSNHIGLYITNVIWFIYTYCICNFLISAKSRTIDPSLQFYIFIRFFWHLVAEHKCFRGRRIVAFKYPNFTRDWRFMLYVNKFIRICPFVFEIQTILIWMSQKTKVPLLSFFAIRDVELQLENVIAQQSDPKAKDPNRNQRMYLKGGLLLLVIALILFIPLFFLSSGTQKTVYNPPVSAKLEIGISSFITVYESMGVINTITTDQHQEIANSGIEDLYFMVISGREAITTVEFPQVSFVEYDPSTELVSIMNDVLKSETQITPYYRFTLFFDLPTSVTTVQNVVYQGSLPPLSQGNLEILSQVISGNSTEQIGPLQLPLVMAVSTDDNPHVIQGMKRDLGLSLKTVVASTSYWELLPQSANDTMLSFLNSDSSYKLLLYSQDVTENAQSAIISTDPSTIGIYLLIIITLGMILRYFALSLPDSIWIEKMTKPMELYRMTIAVNAFRAARDVEKEKEMADQLLDTLRSREDCLKLTT